MTPKDTKKHASDAIGEQELLTIEQVRELLQVGRSFAYSLVRSGELPSYRVGSKLLRIRRRDVEHWLEEQRCLAGK